MSLTDVSTIPQGAVSADMLKSLLTKVGDLSPSGNQTMNVPSGSNFRINGVTKLFNRLTAAGVSGGTTDSFAVECKTEYAGTAAEHWSIQATCDWRADGAAGGGIRAIYGLARVRSGQTITSTANCIGVQAQVANSGTINGSGIHAGLYANVLAGGTWTSVSRLAAAWIDNHLAAAPGSGGFSMVYITNNGAATVDEAFYIYAGNKITNLFSIDTASGMVAAAGTPANLAGSIKVNIVGTGTRYLGLYDASTGG